jgi:hypothetical protein
MDFKTQLLPKITSPLSGSIVIGASKTVTMKDIRRKEASERAGNIPISSALEIGLSFTGKTTAL